jgi:CDP-diacylglycerol--glycerol-3-phosphate 3-phosphatidyltransferase
MFGTRVQQRARFIAEIVVRPLAGVGLTPNALTILGLLLNVITAVIIGLGFLRIGGALVLFAGLFDLLDGAMARVTNKKSTFGAFLDSTLDRYSEGVVLLGLVVYSLRQPPSVQNTWIIVLAYIAVLGSLMVSYTRARAEGLGLECKSGLLARPERVLLLAVGLLTHLVLPMLAIMALLANLTAMQRIMLVWRRVRTPRRQHKESIRPTNGASVPFPADADHDEPDRPALLERWRSVRR